MACSSNAASWRAKQAEICDSWTLVIHRWGTFDLVGFNVILGLFDVLVYKHSLKFGILANYYNTMWCTFDLFVFKVVLSQFSILASKLLLVERN